MDPARAPDGEKMIHLLSVYGYVLLAEAFLVSGLYLTWPLALRAAGHGPVYLRWCVWGVALQFWLTAGFHVLLALHCFNLTGAAAWTALSFLFGRLLAAKAGNYCFAGEACLWWRWLCQSVHRERFLLAALPLIIAPLAVCLVRPALGYDYLMYHGIKAALWAQHGQMVAYPSPGPWSYYANFAAGGSVAPAWAMLLFHSDRLVSFVSVLYWPFFVLCNYALGRELGLASRSAWLIAWLIASVPSVLFFKSDGLVDVPMHSFLACALVFALRGLRLSGDGALLPWLGIACGLVGSCKLTGLPVAAILMATPVLMLRTGVLPFLLARRTLLGLLLCVLVILPWCLYDIAATGYPLSPFSITVAGLHLGQTPPDMTWYLGMPLPSLHPRWEQELIALRQVFISNFPGRVDPFLLPLVLLAPVGLWRLWNRQWRMALLLGILTLCFAGYYASSSFTSIRLTHASINGRFFLAAFTYLAALGYPALRRLVSRIDLYLAIVILFELAAFAFYDWTPDSLATLPAFAVALLLLSIGLYRLAGRSRLSSAALTVLVVLPALILGSFALHNGLRAGFLQQRWDWKGAYAPAFIAVDDGRPHRIDVTSGPYQKGEEMQPLLLTGRDLQNEVIYVPISKSGAIIPDSDPQRQTEADYDAWQARLRSGQIDYVMSFIPESTELDWMRSHPEAFEKIAGAEGNPENTWGLYRVLPAVKH